MDNSSGICNTLDETLRPRTNFWKIQTWNQLMLQTTMKHLFDLGLIEKWKIWANWRYMLFMKLLTGKDSPKSDHIGFKIFPGVFVIWSFLILAAGLILVCEVCTTSNLSFVGFHTLLFNRRFKPWTLFRRDNC